MPRQGSGASEAKRPVKFVGDVDIRRIDKGDTFGGRLPGGLSRTVQWDWTNEHLHDIGDLPAEEQELVLTEPDLVDVTGRRVHPVPAVVSRRRSIAPVPEALNATGVGGDQHAAPQTPTEGSEDES